MSVIQGMHPVLDQQRVMNGGVAALGGIPERNADGAVYPGYDTDFSLDRRIPITLAGVVLGSLITLIALRALGFRFSFGASVGTGG